MNKPILTNDIERRLKVLSKSSNNLFNKKNIAILTKDVKSYFRKANESEKMEDAPDISVFLGGPESVVGPILRFALYRIHYANKLFGPSK